MKLLGSFQKLLLTYVGLPEKGCTVMKHTNTFQSSGCICVGVSAEDSCCCSM